MTTKTTVNNVPTAPGSSTHRGLKNFFSRRNSYSSSDHGSNKQQEQQQQSPLKKSLSITRNERAKKKGKRLGGLLFPPKREDLIVSAVIQTSAPTNVSAAARTRSPVLSAATDRSEDASSPRSPKRESLFNWQDRMWEKERRELLTQKQLIKERDGFCRRVDKYDGQVISVEGKPAYELGNYLGGGVAGVVYEGHRLRPMEEYPVRLGHGDTPKVVSTTPMPDANSPLANHPIDLINVGSMLTCGASSLVPEEEFSAAMTPHTVTAANDMNARDGSLLTVDTTEMPPPLHCQQQQQQQYHDPDDATAASFRTSRPHTEDMALEATESQDQMVIIDTVDAPSRSKHYAKAISMNVDAEFPSDASISYGIMEETVAIKVLNPVGFRTVGVELTRDAVIAREGAPLDRDMVDGGKPMDEKHVWWLINPNSRNLRTLQRYTADAVGPRRVEVDRGSPDKGLRISLIAAYKDPKSKQLKELPLTRCIEIWGHVPFGATDAEFNSLMTAIDRIGQGQPPPPLEAFGENGQVPGRVATGGTASTGNSETLSLESLKLSTPMTSKRTGIYRAASTTRTTVFCQELKAYIALPPVPSKYLKWLKQRRAATKEIRNMMLIGRHRNVVHLFEVLELIQENKSTMFLVLELVRGGELFDLISSNTAKMSSSDRIPLGFTEAETVMRKFFRELASGVHYCHSNGIAHRDLKPENLLVHNTRKGNCELKIADFGLSAAFGPSLQNQNDQDTVIESVVSPPMSPMSGPRSSTEVSLMDEPYSPGEALESPLKQKMDSLFSAGVSLLSCGTIDDIVNCRPRKYNIFEDEPGPSPLKRMTSVVGSPHYVAPEIISQNEHKRKKKTGEPLPPGQVVGYDGTRADVWSGGVILYAMLFRSLPFGEDLLRCPRYQSFKKWYDEVASKKGRRSSAAGMLDPVITEVDERDFLGPHWFFPSETSPESRDLIVAMLNPNPDVRPTIEMVLKHPWLVRET